MIKPDDRSFVVHAYIRNDDDTYGHYSYNNYLEAVTDLKDEEIIFIVANDLALDAEVTYEQPSKPYNRTIWHRQTDKSKANAN